MKPTLRSALFVLALGSAFIVPAAFAYDSNAWQSAQADFQRARAGEAGAATDAAEKFSKLVATEPTNPLLLAYLGSAQSMQGRDAWAPWKKMKFVEAGLADIDRALALLKPEHAQAPAGGVSVSNEVKLTAASTYLGLPGFFNRADAGAKLAKELAAQPGFATTPERYRSAVLKLTAKAKS
ncbi:hypothetical protein OPU71_04750 [Niveibacterium sp. 24ML]|uniref:hypothetical protein n=1 Tax=Niveibacterium sp. 24ML TaxID=2985512 RepID=UPI00226D9DDA|nr:hypothetical protein [Niveibacterium sp. 24ML]MCX9155428.1 hypothetical protein [Niveibacterium sp. 24ML]